MGYSVAATLGLWNVTATLTWCQVVDKSRVLALVAARKNGIQTKSIMITKQHSLSIVLALLAGVHAAPAQSPVIRSFSQNGVLVCTNLEPGSVATVLEAPTVNGPWTTNADGLSVTLNGTIQVSGLVSATGSKFYRVRGVAQAPIGTVLIPAASFTMGDTLDGLIWSLPISVTVSAFYMDVNLVSWSQWQTVYNYATNNGYLFFTNVTYGVYQAGGKAANHPVQKVNWWDVVKWSNARSQQAGLTPVYYTDAGLTQVYTNSEPTTVYANWVANGYRLPTEAEWEKAARGGLSGQRFPWGNSISGSQANYYGATASYSYDLGPNGYNPIGNYPTDSVGTSPVGSFAANGYGLYDMAGNVYEWCWDWYDTPYGQPTADNPTGPAGPLSYRVLRGGYWYNYADFARCARRGFVVPNKAGNYIGFRCVKGL